MRDTKRRTFLAAGLLLGTAILLTACGGKQVTEVHTLEVRASAAADVNPDLDGRPSPIILHILELTGVDQFNRADYFALTRDDAASLGGDVLSKTEVILTPGSSKTTALELDIHTSYLGLVAGYRDLDHSMWREAQPVVVGKTDWISLTLEKARITIDEVNN